MKIVENLHFVMELLWKKSIINYWNQHEHRRLQTPKEKKSIIHMSTERLIAELLMKYADG